MKLKPHHKGCTVRKYNFPPGDFYLVLTVGKFINVFKDQDDKEIIEDHDDNDNDWVLIKYPQPPMDLFDHEKKTYPEA